MENMDNNLNWDQNKPMMMMMINELTQGKDLVKQLGIHLDRSSSPTGELLISKIISSIENVLSMLNSGSSSSEGQGGGSASAAAASELVDKQQQQLTGVTAAAMAAVESPRSVSGSPRSDDDSSDPVMMRDRDKSKKRKMLPRWTEQVRVSSGTGLEGPLDDGYSWRKYGQKDILGAKYPRGYYRCTHRNVQGCLATKQVQRSDEDPSMFGITYRGRHTCIQASHLLPLQSPKKQNQGQAHDDQQKQASSVLLNFRTGLEVKTENLDTRPDFRCSSFSFPASTSTTLTDCCLENENHIFSSLTPENNFMGNFSPPFISPTTSESNYYSPYRMNSSFGGGGHNLQTSESDLIEIISAATSTTNSPILDLDFSLDPVDFDPHFPFDCPGFFN